MLTWIVAVFLSILIHELGHALVMRAYGFRPWITLYGLGGQASYDLPLCVHVEGIGALAQVLISAAGPAAGFCWSVPFARALRGRLWQPYYFTFSPWGLCPAVICQPAAGRVLLRHLLRLRGVGHGQPLADLSVGRRQDRPRSPVLAQSARRHSLVALLVDRGRRGDGCDRFHAMASRLVHPGDVSAISPTPAT